MSQTELFLLSDAALRRVIDQIQPDQFALPAPEGWTSKPSPTLRDIVAAHAKDEAWVPDVLAGRTMEEVGTAYDGDLLGADPIASYDALNDTATDAINAGVDLSATAHLSYGDFPVGVYFEHTSFYRAFQAWSIAKFIGVDATLPPRLVDLLWDVAIPQLETLREWHVFGPEVEVPAGSDKQTQLLGKTGFWAS